LSPPLSIDGELVPQRLVAVEFCFFSKAHTIRYFRLLASNFVL
jgi:hypothetical protein